MLIFVPLPATLAVRSSSIRPVVHDSAATAPQFLAALTLQLSQRVVFPVTGFLQEVQIPASLQCCCLSWSAVSVLFFCSSVLLSPRCFAHSANFLRQFLHWVLVETVLIQQVHRPCSFRRRRLSFSRMLRFCLCMSSSFNQEGRRSGCGHSSGFGFKTTVQVYLCVPQWPGNAPLLQKRTGGH